MNNSKLLSISASLLLVLSVLAERKIMEKHTKRQHIKKDLPYQTLGRYREMPETFNWLNFEGENNLSRSLNQHLPVYCGSCWAHAAASVIADRIKIIRLQYLRSGDEFDEDGFYPDVSLSIQFILNCGAEIAGSCKGGSATGAFQFIKEIGYIPFETCQPYMACSSDSDEEFCQHVDTTCTPINICKTCTRNIPHGTGSTCNQVSQFPHARIDEYGVYKLEEADTMDDHIFMVKAEIATRGPVTAGIAGHHLKNYTGGILYDDELLRNIQPTHEVSIVGWDVDDETGVEYWIIRNSWGEYWGEMSFFRLQLGTNMLGVEKEISWATIYDFSIENVPCYEDGRNCNMAALSFVPGVGQMS